MYHLAMEERQDNLDECLELFSGLPLQNSERELRLVTFCERYKTNILSVMPWVASEFAAYSGFENLFKLLHSYGGRKIYLPKELSKFCHLYGVDIPQHSYHKLYKKADSSGYLDVPSTWGVFIAIRRAAMQIAMKENIPAKLLTQTFGVTMRNIRLIKSRNSCL
ncbi:hypothetical protein FHU10_2692 [Serratia fonticola]|jgi:hypothetical protein|uniref:Uncharacterized protein n=1 Tax=Serratia fonticola TaxID=47917 RepID=A0A542CXU2_SERFO|nr:hypothetical protein [Serratia fonticola]TQI82339.1 hypothetical protein FHU09_5017 [Serratia fonticola]TQI95641.1 hypothetical protein FHU11_1033 [Serratia fonticola]TVZ70137.1 hypothetical protein FHU10_2692 [Serratia fonticola]